MRGYIKRRIARREKQFDDPEEQELVCNGERLEDQRLIDEICCKHNDAVVHLFVRKKHVKVQRRPLELSIVAKDLIDKKKNDVNGNTNRRSYDANLGIKNILKSKHRA